MSRTLLDVEIASRSDGSDNICVQEKKLVIATFSIVNWRAVAASVPQRELASLLHKLFLNVDGVLANQKNIFRVDVIVERCLFAIAAEADTGESHDIVSVCYALIRACHRLQTNGNELILRVGIHACAASWLTIDSSGSRPLIFGSGVDDACSYERFGIASCIQLSWSAFRHVQTVLIESALPAGASFVQRGEVDMGGALGSVDTWLVIPPWLDRHVVESRLNGKPLVGKTVDMLESFCFSSDSLALINDTCVVLSVSNDSMRHKVIQDILGSAGFDVVSVMTGAALVEYFREIDEDSGIVPHVVLMDDSVSGESGLTLSKVIREQFCIADLAILLVSYSSPLDEGLSASLGAGCNDYIRAPFEERDIIARVKCLYAVSSSYRSCQQRESSRLPGTPASRNIARLMECNSQSLLPSMPEVPEEDLLGTREEPQNIRGLDPAPSDLKATSFDRNMPVIHGCKGAEDSEHSNNRTSSSCNQKSTKGVHGHQTNSPGCSRRDVSYESMFCEFARLRRAGLEHERLLWSSRNELAACDAALTVSRDESAALWEMMFSKPVRTN
eukprot:TRINITY_DN77153_c0_g1_i1.p1 TRINITY_DN77153_c0_g1~~TRINITY_DN77153_c0_g1_i1.p1  ORF type:complete len:559 (-),score=61.11 TRINITY_DN77153_c0_g1_i1:62-1738(-)